MKKLRLLCVNDAHFLFTGYAKYGHEVLSRLAATGKYEIAELACYGEVNQAADIYAPWTYYANAVPYSHKMAEQYQSNPLNEFGKWRFERTLLDFKPDVVIDIRDPWCATFEYMSPLRPFFHWAIMPTVDSAPQKRDWIDMFCDADSVFTYTNWGGEVLKKESNNTIRLAGIASPGVDIDTYKPVLDKEQHKMRMGFFPNSYLVGIIARNQARKLYPDLFESFKNFLNLCKEKDSELGKKTYLYVHTGYPDMGWDIPELLMEHEIGHKVIFTYICKSCGHVFISFYRDIVCVCPQCKSLSAILPNTRYGVDPSQLANIVNMFDVYIQYATNEGFGMSMAEAAGCGVPILAVDYSAMSDVVKNTYGIPLPVERMFRDVGTHSYRALPNNKECASVIYEFLQKPDSLQRIMGHKARTAAENMYTWDHTAKAWENRLDTIELGGLQGQWQAPMRSCEIYKGPIPSNKQLSNRDFIGWIIDRVMQEPKWLNTRFSAKLLKDLEFGGRPSGKDVVNVNRKTIFQDASNYIVNKRECELARVGAVELEDQDFIRYARMRNKYIV